MKRESSNGSGGSGTASGSRSSGGSGNNEEEVHRDPTQPQQHRERKTSWDAAPKSDRGMSTRRKSFSRSNSRTIPIEPVEAEFERKYDLTPVERLTSSKLQSSAATFPIDPWEVAPTEQERIEAEQMAAAPPL